MSDPAPSQPSTDRNLLFGILVLQMDFISRDALIDAIWVKDKAKPLGQILAELGHLKPPASGARGIAPRDPNGVGSAFKLYQGRTHAASGREVMTLLGHRNAVTCVALARMGNGWRRQEHHQVVFTRRD
jgi:hypothetical protein